MSDERAKFEDGQRREFFIVGNDVLKNHGEKIGPYGVAAYCAILMFASADGSGAFPSIRTMAELVGMSERQARTVIGRLESEGLIRVTRRIDGDGRRTTSVYTALGSPASTPTPDGGVGAPRAVAPAGHAPTTRHVVQGVGAPRAYNQDPHYQDPHYQDRASDVTDVTSTAPDAAQTGHTTTPSQRWAPFFDRLSVHLGGARVTAAKGKPLAWAGETCQLFGKATNGDLSLAVSLLDEFARSEDWRFYSPKNTIAAGKWLRAKIQRGWSIG